MDCCCLSLLLENICLYIQVFLKTGVPKMVVTTHPKPFPQRSKYKCTNNTYSNTYSFCVWLRCVCGICILCIYCICIQYIHNVFALTNRFVGLFGAAKELLHESDYVVNILPHTESTRNLLGGDVLRACTEPTDSRLDQVVFINVGRGSILTAGLDLPLDFGVDLDFCPLMSGEHIVVPLPCKRLILCRGSWPSRYY